MQAAPTVLPSCFEAALKENFQSAHLCSVLLGGIKDSVLPLPARVVRSQKSVQGLWVIFSCEDKGVLLFGVFILCEKKNSMMFAKSPCALISPFHFPRNPILFSVLCELKT